MNTTQNNFTFRTNSKNDSSFCTSKDTDCFSHLGGDMLVATPDGAKASSALEVGDYVLAYHEGRGEIGSYPIAAIWAHEVPVMVQLTFDGETISITPKHLFYTPHGWVEAGVLSIGETLIRADGRIGVVRAVQVVSSRQLVYNLTVAEAHTYFGQPEKVAHSEDGPHPQPLPQY